MELPPSDKSLRGTPRAEPLRDKMGGNASREKFNFDAACAQEKDAYSKCFSEWYNEQFLKGKSVTSPCRDVFEDYRACVEVGAES
jgi:hypothetical protein